MLTQGLVLGLLTTVTAGLLPSDTDYKRMRNFYDDLGCTAVSGGNLYDCSKVLGPEVPGKCAFRDQYLNPGENLPDDGRISSCLLPCSCSAPDATEPGSIICPSVSCPRPKNYDGGYKPGCSGAFSSLQDCCPSEIVCEGEVNRTCSYENETYLHGQLIYPDSSDCLVCRCQDNFGITAGDDGRPKTVAEGGSCQTISCSTILNVQQVKKRCAPVFEGKSCCPWDFHCPAEEEKLIKSEEEKEATGEKQCQFGSLHVAIGDEMQTRDSSLKCSCYVPPFVTCVKKTLSTK